MFRGGGGPNQNVRQDLGLQFRGVPRPRKPDLENDMWDWSQPMFQHRKKSSSAEDYGYSEDDGSSRRLSVAALLMEIILVGFR